MCRVAAATTSGSASRAIEEVVVLAEKALLADLHERIFRPSAGPARIGVEIELLPYQRSSLDTVPKRVTVAHTREIVAQFAVSRDAFFIDPAVPSRSPTGVNGTLSYEPGGQIEFSGPPRETPAAAHAEMLDVVRGLTSACEPANICLRSFAFDPWTDSNEFPLQLQLPRYHAFMKMFDSVGPWGRAQAINTTSIQVCIDFGHDEQVLRRWRVAQRLSPIATAVFAASPFCKGSVSGYHSFRAFQWFNTEPTRQRFPGFTADASADPAQAYLHAALDTRVAVIRRDSGWIVPPQALTFGTWMREGYLQEHPTLDDWRYHLTTLWPEVRPQGYIELRGVDNQCTSLSSVPITFWCALLLDDRALDECLSSVSGEHPRARLQAAIQHGLQQPALRHDAQRLWQIAADSISRAPTGYFSEPMKSAFRRYAEMFVFRGRTPADDFLQNTTDAGVRAQALDRTILEWDQCVGVA